MDISFARGRREWGVGKESKRKGADTVIQWQCSGRNTGGSRCKSFQEALSTGCSVQVTGNSDDDQLGSWHRAWLKTACSCVKRRVLAVAHCPDVPLARARCNKAQSISLVEAATECRSKCTQEAKCTQKKAEVCTNVVHSAACCVVSLQHVCPAHAKVCVHSM